jgi:HTH-type transcriptional regulator/antitoxin HipB
MSFMKDIAVSNAEQLGGLIRKKRQEKRLSQVALAGQIGVGRKWIINLEAGNPRAELGAILKALDVLNLHLSASDANSGIESQERRPRTSRLDEVFHRLQRSTRK